MFVSLRAMLAEFTEPEQRQMIAQLKRMYANLEEAHKQDAKEPTP